MAGTIHIQDYRSGGRGRYSLYRVTWSTVPDIHAAMVDLRVRLHRQLATEGKVGSHIVHGAESRDTSVDWAFRKCGKDARVTYE